ncbi:MAG: Cell shape-determining protein MreC, partial [Parcubacteria group bacterium GW2011_GWE2_38_18]
SVGAVIMLLIFLHFSKIILPLESFILKSLSPLLNGMYQTSSKIKSSYDQQTDKRDLSAIVEQQNVELNQLISENSRLKSLEDENKTLRSYLKFLSTKEKNYAMANVISSGGIDINSQTVLLDKGTKDGLYSGLAVLSSEGNIVGKIINAKENISEICLVNASRCQLAAAIQNKDKTVGIAQGDLGLTIKMEFIPQSAEIKVGDIIISSGLEKSIPRGLVIGQISQVKKESNELWQSARIESLTNLEDLVVVSVLLP